VPRQLYVTYCGIVAARPRTYSYINTAEGFACYSLLRAHHPYADAWRVYRRHTTLRLPPPAYRHHTRFSATHLLPPVASPLYTRADITYIGLYAIRACTVPRTVHTRMDLQRQHLVAIPSRTGLPRRKHVPAAAFPARFPYLPCRFGISAVRHGYIPCISLVAHTRGAVAVIVRVGRGADLRCPWITTMLTFGQNSCFERAYLPYLLARGHALQRYAWRHCLRVWRLHFAGRSAARPDCAPRARARLRVPRLPADTYPPVFSQQRLPYRWFMP